MLLSTGSKHVMEILFLIWPFLCYLLSKDVLSGTFSNYNFLSLLFYFIFLSFNVCKEIDQVIVLDMEQEPSYKTPTQPPGSAVNPWWTDPTHLCFVVSDCGGSEGAWLRPPLPRRCWWYSSGAAGWGEWRESAGSYENPCGRVEEPASPGTPGHLWQGWELWEGKGSGGSWGRSCHPGAGQRGQREEVEASWNKTRRNYRRKCCSI